MHERYQPRHDHGVHGHAVAVPQTQDGELPQSVRECEMETEEVGPFLLSEKVCNG